MLKLRVLLATIVPSLSLGELDREILYIKMKVSENLNIIFVTL
jgi:hypothetical protein